jgi:hypothetical protein
LIESSIDAIEADKLIELLNTKYPNGCGSLIAVGLALMNPKKGVSGCQSTPLKRRSKVYTQNIHYYPGVHRAIFTLWLTSTQYHVSNNNSKVVNPNSYASPAFGKTRIPFFSPEAVKIHLWDDGLHIILHHLSTFGISKCTSLQTVEPFQHQEVV